MIFLTQEQRQRLKNASSNVFGESRTTVPQKRLKEAAKELDSILEQLHFENPFAFNTMARVNQDNEFEFVGIEQELEGRHFFDEPARLEPHKSFVKPYQKEL